MALNEITKQRILSAITLNREHYPSDAKHASALGINSSVYNGLKHGNVERLVSDSTLISIARKLNVELRERMPWKTANTTVFIYITEQLEMCREKSMSVILCDLPGIGKTFTAKQYVLGHKNVVYIDCGQFKTKIRLIRHIAKEFGVNVSGRYADMYDDLVYYLKGIENPLIILDEAGDMTYEAFLELKALWNTTDKYCGWYMMGANGLRAKMERNRRLQTVGYEEMFSRFGDKYSCIVPEGDEQIRFLKLQAMMVAKVNAPKNMKSVELNKLVNKSEGKLRRVYTELEKIIMGTEGEDVEA